MKAAEYREDSEVLYISLSNLRVFCSLNPTAESVIYVTLRCDVMLFKINELLTDFA